ncbi:unnamed protein product [Rodentolepis nana]|uniref:Phospholipase B-like n=1 Tax=Rodentolepis nana TaxID=102285 RepID=A0A3P7V184_RODNA|nr:unnamed protein product [Rodentolepis nana]
MWTSALTPSIEFRYFKFIRNVTGIDALEREYGDVFSYDRTPRAQIFRRDQEKVTDLPSMYRLMRYNDFTRDPLSQCNSTPPYTAFFAIAARGDLNDPNGSYPLPFLGYRLHGSTDVKLVNLAMAKSVRWGGVGLFHLALQVVHKQRKLALATNCALSVSVGSCLR